MRKISKANREIIDKSPFYRRCARLNRSCDGRITIEHALIYAGRQIDEIWAMIPLCEWHHSVCKHQDGGGLDKEKNVWIALNRATHDDLVRYSKVVNYPRMKEVLNEKFGKFSYQGVSAVLSR